MFEINRLKPMVENYDPLKFKRLYDRTHSLRKKLALGIDHRRFGVDQEEVYNWFVTKFIFAYNKYCNKYSEEVLLGHLIRAMQFMKCRILRAAYQPKYSQSIIEYTPNDVPEEVMNPYDEEAKDSYYNILCKFLRDRISDNAYMLFQLELHPPVYVMHEMETKGHHNIHKIPDEVICKYYNLGFDRFSINLLKILREEIHIAIQLAKIHFAKN